jgi:transposase
MDQIFETGTQKIFSQLAQNALTVFAVDPRRLHFDTTSVSVYGDYDLAGPPFDITYGYSKDKRPDLKQFLVSMLCVDRNIPIFGATTDGNASDKTLNNELLTNISKYMAKHGLQPGAYVYVADSAFVTEDNLAKSHGRTWFLSRLPATYNECGRIIREAVLKDDWIDIGPLAEERDRPNRPIAHYRAYDGTVALYGKTYRAIVVHSSAHDKRRHKRIDRMLKQDRKQLEADCKKVTDTVFYFLKKARRIEVLGLILLISLLIWRLMERSMRQYVETNDDELPGWLRRKTRKPNAFMMTTKFTSVMVISIGNHRQLAKPLKSFQLAYLKALGVTAEAFTVP